MGARIPSCRAAPLPSPHIVPMSFGKGGFSSRPSASAVAHLLESRITGFSGALDDFFSGLPGSRSLFDALLLTLTDIGQHEIRVTKSQVAFWRKKPFAWAWVPDKYLRGNHAPLVLTVSLRRRDPSSRWKEVVEPAPGRFTHHMELRELSDIDDQVRAVLQEAWSQAN